MGCGAAKLCYLRRLLPCGAGSSLWARQTASGLEASVTRGYLKGRGDDSVIHTLSKSCLALPQFQSSFLMAPGNSLLSAASSAVQYPAQQRGDYPLKGRTQRPHSRRKGSPPPVLVPDAVQWPALRGTCRPVGSGGSPAPCQACCGGSLGLLLTAPSIPGMRLFQAAMMKDNCLFPGLSPPRLLAPVRQQTCSLGRMGFCFDR